MPYQSGLGRFPGLYNFCALEHTLVYNGIAVFGACTSDSLSYLQVTHVFTLNFQSLKEKELHIIISFIYITQQTCQVAQQNLYKYL